MPQRWESVYMNLMTNDHDWDSPWDWLYRLLSSDDSPGPRKKIRTTKEQMGAVAVTNYAYGFNNPTRSLAGKLFLSMITWPLAQYVSPSA